MSHLAVNKVAHDRYYTFNELTNHLSALAAEYPELAHLQAIGKSHQGREIWLMEITNSATGAPESKPGYYLDAHIHAEEHATSAVALYTIDHLLSHYGRDPLVTQLLDQQVFYILPRLNPDGAEISLTQPYRWCGNGRYLPGEDRLDGLIPQDLDGDGYIVQMRVVDPRGEWKISSLDPRLMVQREPGEDGGTYYRLYPEGLIRNYDGVNVPIERPRDGNLNRNFPAGWAPEAEQYGAGDYPLQEPETRALAEFILAHPNIAGINSYHTHGGVILRPSMTKNDTDMSPRDLTLFQDLGEVGTKLTGYPTISIYEGFTPDKSKPRRGGLMDWTYEKMGIVSFATELWDVEKEAGITKDTFYSLRARSEEAEKKLLDWVLEHWGEQGFRDWHTFNHPQLGPVDIGGFVEMWAQRNPPPARLPQVCHDNMRFNLQHAAAAPRVRVDHLKVEPLGAALYKVRAVVSNHGYLPTNLTDVALRSSDTKPVTIQLELDEAELLMNPQTVALGHLAGRNERKMPWSQWGSQWSSNAASAEWLVRGTSSGARIAVQVRTEKGGSDVREAFLLEA